MAEEREHTPDGTPEGTPEWTIDELAARTRVPSRTIRFYQSKGALPPPTIKGRVAYYGEPHVARLKQIGELQDRGLSIRAIRDLLERADKGELALNEWLGLEHKLSEPWANDRPRIVTEAELVELLGERRPGIVAELLRLGELERRGTDFLVHSPALMQVGLRLEKAGIDLPTAVGAAKILRKHLGRATADLTEHFFARAGSGFGRDIDAGELGKAYEALRPLGLEAVRVIFAQEMERAIRRLVESGATRKITSRSRKPR